MPNAPASISVTAYGSSYLDLQWVTPTDSGIGDTSIAIVDYLLEVDEGFGNGFVELVKQSGLTYTHSNLIKGHEYTYRVSASNFLGYGALSSSYSFTPRTVPGKPSAAPVVDAANSDRTKVVLTHV